MATISLAMVLEDAVKAAAEKAGPAAGQVRIRLETSPAIPPARGDARQIRNALAEIILNAIQATRPAEGDGAAAVAADVTVQAKFDPLDQQIIVQVADHGIGMSDEVMRNAFAPFFSAKSAGRNRGMGLAKALRWVENHGGMIRLDSTLGAGTTAVVILPVNPGGEAGAEAGR
jgi:signal transduction histidine kinase